MTDTPADAARWARAHFVARLIPENADLRNLVSVTFALLNKRLVYKDFWDVIDEAIVLALGNRIDQLRDWDKKSMKQITKYVSFDGQEFLSEMDCRAHERSKVYFRLVGLTAEQIEAALNREDIELADAIELVGAKIARDRRASGESRRARSREEKQEISAEEVVRLAREEADFHEGRDAPLPEDAEIER